MASEAIIAAHTAQCFSATSIFYIIIVSLTMPSVWKTKFHMYKLITIKVIYFIYDLEKIASEVNEYKLKNNTDD